MHASLLATSLFHPDAGEEIHDKTTVDLVQREIPFISNFDTGNILLILPTASLHTVLTWVKLLSSLVLP
jgi:hypothetical protein